MIDVIHFILFSDLIAVTMAASDINSNCPGFIAQEFKDQCLARGLSKSDVHICIFTTSRMLREDNQIDLDRVHELVDLHVKHQEKADPFYKIIKQCADQVESNSTARKTMASMDDCMRKNKGESLLVDAVCHNPQ